MKLIPLHDTTASHLDGVITAMRTLGAPTLRGVWMECYDAYVLLEGTHRAAAAAILGLTPIIIEVEYSEDNAGIAEMPDATIASLCDDAADRANLMIEI